MAPNPVSTHRKDRPVGIFPEIVRVEVVLEVLGEARPSSWPQDDTRGASRAFIVVHHVVAEHAVDLKQSMLQSEAVAEVSVHHLVRSHMLSGTHDAGRCAIRHPNVSTRTSW